MHAPHGAERQARRWNEHAGYARMGSSTHLCLQQQPERGEQAAPLLKVDAGACGSRHLARLHASVTAMEVMRQRRTTSFNCGRMQQQGLVEGCAGASWLLVRAVLPPTARMRHHI